MLTHPEVVRTAPLRPARLDLRARAATRAGALAAALSRSAGLGAGSIIGGRVSLVLDPHCLGKLTGGRQVVVVTGTNGKTTTTAMVTAALATAGQVASNSGGSNMSDGLVAALARHREAPRAVLEVDELHLPDVLAAVQPAVVAVLNLTRDQLDRVGEVNHLVPALRGALASRPGCVVVANADDPLVVASVPIGARVRWVSAGGGWQGDSAACPLCARVLQRAGGDWWCRCGLRRPTPDWQVDEAGYAGPAGARGSLDVQLPGRFNRMNATVALAVADACGLPVGEAVAAIATLTEVAGRYRVVQQGAHRIRLLLTKNPAGTTETLAMLAGTGSEVLLVVNGREADGRDLSWLWDVPFQQLAGRTVTAAGERATDVSVRLGYAGVPHRVVHDPWAALQGVRGAEVDVLANYTAFRDLVGGLRRAG